MKTAVLFATLCTSLLLAIPASAHVGASACSSPVNTLDYELREIREATHIVLGAGLVVSSCDSDESETPVFFTREQIYPLDIRKKVNDEWVSVEPPMTKDSIKMVLKEGIGAQRSLLIEGDFVSTVPPFMGNVDPPATQASTRLVFDVLGANTTKDFSIGEKKYRVVLNYTSGRAE